MSILFYEIQLDHFCGWRGQRWKKVSPHHLIPEGADDVPENRQYVPSHDAVEFITAPDLSSSEPVIHDGQNN